MRRPQTRKHNLRIFLGVTALLMAGFFVFGSAEVFADDKSVTELSKEAKDAIDSREKQLKEIEAQIKAFKSIISLKTKEGASLKDQIDALEAQASKLRLEISENQARIQELSGDIQTLDSRIQEKSTMLEQQRRILSEFMRDYHSAYSNEAIPLLLTAEESALYFNQNAWNNDLSEKIADLLDSIENTRKSLVAEQTSLSEKKKEADELQLQLSQRTAYLESTQNNKESLLQKTQAEIANYDSQVDNLREQQEALEQEIENIEAGKVDELVGLPSGNGLLAYPVEYVRITQGYGRTSFSNHYHSGMHNGIDFGAKKPGKSGDKVMAAADGKVVGTGDLGPYAYGKWVAIEHDGDAEGLVTLYGHLSKISVSKGKSVDKGDKIGEMGSTGFSTGAHLHFTVYASASYEVVPFSSAKGKKGPVGASVNPSRYLR